MKPRKILQKAIASPNNVRFRDMIRLVEAFGFVCDRISGSHHIFIHLALNEFVNLQNRKGKAKPYQVEQFLALVEEHHLELGD